MALMSTNNTSAEMAQKAGLAVRGLAEPLRNMLAECKLALSHEKGQVKNAEIEMPQGFNH